MKDDSPIVFVVAALFHAARLAREETPNYADSIDMAKCFVSTAKLRGVAPPDDL
jgi:hypothetical protein